MQQRRRRRRRRRRDRKSAPRRRAARVLARRCIPMARRLVPSVLRAIRSYGGSGPVHSDVAETRRPRRRTRSRSSLAAPTSRLEDQQQASAPDGERDVESRAKGAGKDGAVGDGDHHHRSGGVVKASGEKKGSEKEASASAEKRREVHRKNLKAAKAATEKNRRALEQESSFYAAGHGQMDVEGKHAKAGLARGPWQALACWSFRAQSSCAAARCAIHQQGGCYEEA